MSGDVEGRCVFHRLCRARLQWTTTSHCALLQRCHLGHERYARRSYMHTHLLPLTRYRLLSNPHFPPRCYCMSGAYPSGWDRRRRRQQPSCEDPFGSDVVTSVMYQASLPQLNVDLIYSLSSYEGSSRQTQTLANQSVRVSHACPDRPCISRQMILVSSATLCLVSCTCCLRAVSISLFTT